MTIEYGIETETKMLKVWNGSNQEPIRFDVALAEIADDLEREETDGEVSDGSFNTIHWESIDK